MRDYEELVKSLRICADSADPISECCFSDCCEHDEPIDPLCMGQLIHMAADAIEELQKSVELEYQSGFADGQISANRKKNRWISVEERLPEDGESIIAVIEDYSTWDDENDDIAVSAEPNGAMTVIGIYRNKRFRWYDESGVATIDMNDSDIENLGLRLVSWMPLPEPPKEEADA